VPRPSAVQVAAEQHRGQTREPIKGSQHTLLTAGAGVRHRELANDHAEGWIFGIDPPGVGMLTAVQPCDRHDLGRRAGETADFLKRPGRGQNSRSGHHG
jgi:hypothetical protein